MGQGKSFEEGRTAGGLWWLRSYGFPHPLPPSVHFQARFVWLEQGKKLWRGTRPGGGALVAEMGCIPPRLLYLRPSPIPERILRESDQERLQRSLSRSVSEEWSVAKATGTTSGLQRESSPWPSRCRCHAPWVRFPLKPGFCTWFIRYPISLEE